MKYLPELFENNKKWAAGNKKANPNYFQELSETQKPRYLWVGCADSRVPANEIVGLGPGELFVHRNVANLAPPGDTNFLSVLQFAVDALKVEHVIVCGHYRCGGVLAALREDVEGPLSRWIQNITAVRQSHLSELNGLADETARWKRLCELNVEAQLIHIAGTRIAREAWAAGQRLFIHGWIYDIRDGLLRDLGKNFSGEEDLNKLTVRG